MITVRHLLKNKGDNVWTVGPRETVYRALEIMAEKDVGALLVVDDGSVVGVFSERDYARKVVLQGKTSQDTSVGELMTREVVSIKPDQNLNECMTIMTKNRVRHLPVMENGSLTGLISIGDVVNTIIKEQKSTIGQLENYISGGS